ncbi:GH3 family domain-containing protein, partial [Escherichia coli]
SMTAALRKLLKLLFIQVIGKPIAYPIRRKLYRFDEATHDPERVQQTVLQGILKYQADTGFGRDHGFEHIGTPADFRRQLPVAGYDYFE